LLLASTRRRRSREYPLTLAGCCTASSALRTAASPYSMLRAQAQELDRALVLSLSTRPARSPDSTTIRSVWVTVFCGHHRENRKKNMNQLTNLKSLILIPFALACFALSLAQAQLPSPAPDGGYLKDNTAEGDDALFNLTTGNSNTALGHGALFSNTTGFDNTATGDSALFSNTTGGGNTATGLRALSSNTTGDGNTANGILALQDNTTGFLNTATGDSALFSNTTGSLDTATGVSALFFNTTGTRNTATGFEALQNNTTGSRNTATGSFTLQNNTTGNHNAAYGWTALFNNTTGNFNIALGDGAGSNLTTGDNNIDIGNPGVAAEANTIRIGTQGTQTATFIAGISGGGVTGMAVKVNAAGQVGTAPSSKRFKDQIKPMDKASEAILALKPVTFRYKKEIDADGIPQFGLVAEEVEKVNPDLITRDRDGKPYTVRYEVVNAMLLNEFLKAHRRIEEQDKRIERLTAQLKHQAALIQKVNDEVELNRPAPQMAVNNQ